MWKQMIYFTDLETLGLNTLLLEIESESLNIKILFFIFLVIGSL